MDLICALQGVMTRMSRGPIGCVLIPPLPAKQAANQAGHLGSLLGRSVGVALMRHLDHAQASPAQGILCENLLTIEAFNRR